MASHVIGPFLVASEPLSHAERSTLEAAAQWTISTLEPALPQQPFTPGLKVVFDARPQRSHGSQRGVPLTLPRSRPAYVTLPQRMTASPLRGSFVTGLAEVIVLVEGSYSEGAYGSGAYGDE